MMKPIIFTSALLLGSAIAGEALAAACPISGQVMDISAIAEVKPVKAVKGVAEVLPVTEKYTFTFPTVAKKCSITVGNKTFTASNSSSSNSTDVGNYFSNNAPTDWTVSTGKIFTSKTAGANVTDLPYSTSNVANEGGCQTKPIIVVNKTEGAAAVAAVAEVKEVKAVAEIAANPQLTTLLTGKTVCDANATYDSCAKHPERNPCVIKMGIQEQHRSGGQLWDYKMGSDAIDPTVRVGDWLITGHDADTVVKYAYPPGGTPSAYKVFDAGAGTYYFCSGTTIVATAKITSAQNCS